MTWFSMSLLSILLFCPISKDSHMAPVAHLSHNLQIILEVGTAESQDLHRHDMCSSHSQAGHTEHGGKLRYPHVLW
jgi:hypothetical protein